MLPVSEVVWLFETLSNMRYGLAAPTRIHHAGSLVGVADVFDACALS
jgi:hypothetical protein